MHRDLPPAAFVGAMNLARDTALDIFIASSGDLHPVDATIRIAVHVAAHRRVLSDRRSIALYGERNTTPPRETLLPVTIASVAATTDLPFETARRRAARLVAAGWFEHTPKGLILAHDDLSSAGYLAMLEAVAAIVKVSAERYRILWSFAPNVPEARLFWQADKTPLRAVSFIAAEFFLRVLEESTARTGSLVTYVILSEIIRRNIGHMGDFSPAALAAGTPPHGLDSRKRPATAAHVSAVLNLDRETTRRHLLRLQKVGLCERVGDGYIVPRRVLESPVIMGAATIVLNAQRRLYRDLAALGALGEHPAPAGRAPALGSQS